MSASTRALWAVVALVWALLAVRAAADSPPPRDPDVECGLGAVEMGDTCILDLDDGCWVEIRLHVDRGRSRLGAWRFCPGGRS